MPIPQTRSKLSRPRAAGGGNNFHFESQHDPGWSDDAENDGGWDANGFARVNNLVPEEFLVQIVRKAPGGVAEVTRLLFDGEADGEIRLAGVNAEPGEQVAVIVSAVTREVGSVAG